MITEREHNAWLRVQQDAGWRYGETYSEEAKTDPKMVPYAHLAMEDGAAIDVVADQPVEDDTVVDPSIDDLAQAEADEAEAGEETSNE